MKYVYTFLTLLILVSCDEEVRPDPFKISDKKRDSIYLKVQELYVGKKYLEAESLLKTVRPRDVFDNNYYYFNAVVKYHLKKYSESIQFVNSTLKNNSNIENISLMHSVKAASYLAINLPDSALASLNKAIELDSTNTEYILRRVMMYEAMKLHSQQLNDIKRLIRIDENNVDYHIALYEAKLEMADTIGALTGIDSVLTKFPNNVRALFLHAQIAFSSGRKKEAKKYYQKCIDIEPTHGMIFFQMASILSEEKKNAQACDCLLKAVELGNQTAMAHIYKCEDYLRKKGISIKVGPDTVSETTDRQITTEM